jgi:hypothetical protein
MSQANWTGKTLTHKPALQRPVQAITVFEGIVKGMDAVNNWGVSPIFDWKSRGLLLTIARGLYTEGIPS